MRKTTVYLPEALKRRLERVAQDQNRSEADLIREAIERFTAGQARPRPRLPLFSSVDPGLADRVDEVLRGFGER